MWLTGMPPKRAVNQGMRESSILDQTGRWQILMAESMGSVSEHRSESATLLVKCVPLTELFI